MSSELKMSRPRCPGSASAHSSTPSMLYWLMTQPQWLSVRVQGLFHSSKTVGSFLVFGDLQREKSTFIFTERVGRLCHCASHYHLCAAGRRAETDRECLG